VRFANAAAAKGWDSLCGQAPGNTYTAWVLMRSDPLPGQGRTSRHHPLMGSLANGVHRGVTLPRWQIEVTGGGRIWYLVDQDRRTVWIDWAGAGHPRATG
jgi:hypothetical protein